MTWYEKIISAHTAVTDAVSHGKRIKSNRYFVWMEDGSSDFQAGNKHVEKAITGTTDLFTKIEFDPWKNEIEKSFDNTQDIAWYLNSVQFEEETGFWHYEWVWSVF